MIYIGEFWLSRSYTLIHSSWFFILKTKSWIIFGHNIDFHLVQLSPVTSTCAEQLTYDMLDNAETMLWSGFNAHRNFALSMPRLSLSSEP